MRAPTRFKARVLFALATLLAFAAFPEAWAAGDAKKYYLANFGGYYYAMERSSSGPFAQRDSRYSFTDSGVLPVMSAQVFPLGIGDFNFGAGVGYLPFESRSFVVKDDYKTLAGTKSNLAGKRVSYSDVDIPLIISSQYSITEAFYASVGAYALAYHLTESSVAQANNPCSKKLDSCPRTGSFEVDLPSSVTLGLGYRHKFEAFFLQGQIDVWWGWRNAGFLHIIPQVGIGRNF